MILETLICSCYLLNWKRYKLQLRPERISIVSVDSGAIKGIVLIILVIVFCLLCKRIYSLWPLGAITKIQPLSKNIFPSQQNWSLKMIFIFLNYFRTLKVAVGCKLKIKMQLSNSVLPYYTSLKSIQLSSGM